MTRFFTRERFGRPQFLAGPLLLAFLAQASWLVHSELHVDIQSPRRSPRTSASTPDGFNFTARASPARLSPISPSDFLSKFSQADGYDTEHSPLLSLVTAAPLLASPQSLLDPESSSTGAGSRAFLSWPAESSSAPRSGT